MAGKSLRGGCADRARHVAAPHCSCAPPESVAGASRQPPPCVSAPCQQLRCARTLALACTAAMADARVAAEMQNFLEVRRPTGCGAACRYLRGAGAAKITEEAWLGAHKHAAPAPCCARRLLRVAVLHAPAASRSSDRERAARQALRQADARVCRLAPCCALTQRADGEAEGDVQRAGVARDGAVLRQVRSSAAEPAERRQLGL